MASAGATVVDTALQHFFCHKCNRSVTVNLTPNSDPLCPTCNEGFLEEIENPNPDLFFDQFAPLAALLSSFPIAFSDSRSPTSAASIPVNPRNDSSFSRTSRTQSRTNPLEPSGFDPFAFFHDYVEALRADGANIQLVFESHPSGGGGGGGGLPANLGDYFMGPGLEELMQQLAENDPNRYGTPPASKSAVEGLPDVTVDDKLMNSEMAECAVCQDDFEKDMVVKKMPCKHIYHSECLLPWLELHNSCPVCRYELPTDDPDYENRARGDAGSGGGNVRGAGLAGWVSDADTENDVSAPMRGVMERTFSILFRPQRGSGNDNNAGGSSGGDSGSGGQQNMDTD